MTEKFTLIKDLPSLIDQKVSLRGWLGFSRNQGALSFYVIRDTVGDLVQAVLKKQIFEEKDRIKEFRDLPRETLVKIKGLVREDKRAPYKGVEVQIHNMKIIGESSTDIAEEYRPESTPQVLFDKRHLVLRTERSSTILRMRSRILYELRQFFEIESFLEITPPTLVQTQVEGGSTLFPLEYFDEEAYLTQSSQLYLETAIFSLGNVYCCLPSYRAEKSRTRRHLTEYTHLEAEMPFFDYEDNLNFQEKMIRSVVDSIVKKYPNVIEKYNPGLKSPDKPYLRLDYAEMIDKLNEWGIPKEEGGKWEVGDDVSEKPERVLIDRLGVPTFITRFPKEMKPFYMKVDPNDPERTLSADLIVPGVGEIIGGSQREDDYKTLLAGFKREGLDTKVYKWYIDLRKYGSVYHSGFGLGIERLVQYIMNVEHIRDTCLFPRMINRIYP
ncbi:MAG: asparagine--tRNA ligase [Candidatus Hodarchaeales archaeon]|jgi:asparaginyl-tRNA synthetase